MLYLILQNLDYIENIRIPSKLMKFVFHEHIYPRVLYFYSFFFLLPFFWNILPPISFFNNSSTDSNPKDWRIKINHAWPIKRKEIQEIYQNVHRISNRGQEFAPRLSATKNKTDWMWQKSVLLEKFWPLHIHNNEEKLNSLKKLDPSKRSFFKIQ